MGARHKLNAAHVNGSLFIAAIAGLMTESWLVFAMVLVVLVVIAFYDGGIRASGRHS